MTGGETVMSSGHGAAACVGGRKLVRFHGILYFAAAILAPCFAS
jgi:hypothetical protein